jgi:lipopolysaccharide biosynthesis glycosyltransferase
MAFWHSGGLIFWGSGVGGDPVFRRVRRAGVLVLAVLLGCLSAEEIHVAFCLDNNFAEPTGVAAYSLCKNKAPDDRLVIHVVMTEPLPEDHRRKFQLLEHLFPGQVIVHIYDDMEKMQCLLQSLEGVDCGEWRSMAIFGRLLLDKILPETLPKVLYLDGDILVLSSLRELWDKLPFENYAAAGVPDGFLYTPEEIEKVEGGGLYGLVTYDFISGAPIPIRTLYHINSGVLLFDLSVIRKEQLFSETIKYAINYQPTFPDQDSINALFHGRILECNGKWNTYSGSTRPPADVAVIHFMSCFPRPWAINPYKLVGCWWQPKHWFYLLRHMTQSPTLWHRYRQESPWRHSAWSLFQEMFSTKRDLAILALVVAIVIISFISSFWAGRFFIRRWRK